MQVKTRRKKKSIMASTTAALAMAQRDVLKRRVRFLYRRSLKNLLSWAVHRDLFYEEVEKLRDRFEENKTVNDLRTIERIVLSGEAELAKKIHPDPYIVPWAPGGSKYARNPPVPPEIGVVFDFGRKLY